VGGSSIINENNGTNGTLVFTGPTFNTLLQIDGFWLLPVPLIDFAGANFYARATAVANLLIQVRMHWGTCSGKEERALSVNEKPTTNGPTPRA